MAQMVEYLASVTPLVQTPIPKKRKEKKKEYGRGHHMVLEVACYYNKVTL
jgi:hypothetical protein